jgi:gluconolactonase
MEPAIPAGILAGVSLLLFTAAHAQLRNVEKKYADKARIEIMDPAMTTLVDAHARVEILGEGFAWSEGPLWIEKGRYLLFSDIPPNRIMKWSEKDGVSLYLQPSGYTGSVPRGGEPGSNALLLDRWGKLVLCQHGDRRMARMDEPLDRPVADFETLADTYDGRRFNSPNDAVYHPGGDLYFTDPPYGLVKGMEDPAKELPYQGVYRLRRDGTVELLYKELSRPNGIAFSRDHRKLYVANSDTNRIWMVFDVEEKGSLANGRIFYDAGQTELQGFPDGMKVHRSGHIFATGPGGVLVLSPDGKLIGRIDVGDLCSNVAFDTREEHLYITANSRLVRVPLKH